MERAVCPCCGSEVNAKDLPHEAEIAEVMDRLRMGRVPAVMFLALWNARGRTVPYDVLAGFIERFCWGDQPGVIHENVRNAKRRLKDRIQDMPLSIGRDQGIGYRMIRTDPDWHWRVVPLFDLTSDEFRFKEA